MKRCIFYLTITSILILTSCAERTHRQLLIGLSKGAGSEHYIQYSKWLKSFDPAIQFVDLYHLSSRDSIQLMMNRVDGLVLTGGPDIYPGRYGAEKDTAICEIDKYRDTVEFMAMDIASRRKIPVLGICRGLQFLNIYYGGTLFVDIPIELGTSVRHRNDSVGYCFHFVKIQKGSELSNLIHQDSIMVNSYHHQGIKNLSLKFNIGANSTDGLVESIEFKTKEQYIKAVQWHPEREDANGFTRPLGREFINNCYKFVNFEF